MVEIFKYLFFSATILSVFYVHYILFLKKYIDTPIQRIYLISVYFISFIIPLIHIPVSISLSTPMNTMIQPATTFVSAQAEKLSTDENYLNTVPFLFFIYLTVVAFFLTRMFFSLKNISDIIQSSRSYVRDEVSIITSNKIKQPFAFWKFIFLPLDRQTEEIFLHEQAHVKQWHTFDLILGEFIKCIHWFNPVAYLIMNEIKLVHECLADKHVLQKGIHPKKYFCEVLNNSNHKSRLTFINSMHQDNMMYRIKKMNRSKPTFVSSSFHIFSLIFIIFLSVALTNPHVLSTVDIKFSNNSGNPDFQFPIDQNGVIRISSEFGQRLHPIYNKKMMHNGIDIKAPINTDVKVAGDGKIIHLEKQHTPKKGYGKYLVVAHENGYQTLYAQLQNYNVQEGDVVKKGTVVGYVGASGISTAPHLHFELLYKNKRIDPMLFLK